MTHIGNRQPFLDEGGKHAGIWLMSKNTNITGDTQCHKPRLVP